MTDNTFGDIYLNDIPYRIDFQSWRGKDIVDFAPRATVPGGSFVMADLGLYQPLVQTDWRHGFGFHWYSDAMGYMQTIGNIDTRQDGLAMMFTNNYESEANNNVKSGMVVFNGNLYTWGAAGLRKYTVGTSTWTSIYNTAAVNFAIAAGSYLFFAPDGIRIKKMDTSDVVTDAGLDGNAIDYKWLIIHNGYLYAGKDGSNAIHFDNSETLASLQGNASDTNRIMVGLGANPTLGAIVYNGNLYVRKSDGVWLIGEDRIARRMLDFSSEESSVNLRSWATINGYVVLPLRDRVLHWNGARVSDITPQKINDTFPYTTYGRFTNFVAVGDFLYCTARTNETNYDEDLLCFDGVGWHKLCTLVDDSTTETITMMAYEAIGNRLWYHKDAATDSTRYIQFQDRSTFPALDFPITGQHSLITSRIDAGFRRVIKSMANLLVETRNCSVDTYFKVYYAVDGGQWIHWRDIKENGIITLNNPGGSSTREFYYIQFRFDFVTVDLDESPILEGYTMRFIMRPLTKMGYNFTVIAANNTQYGMYQDGRAPQDIYNELIDFRNSASPVTMTDMFGVVRTGYVTAIQEQPIYRKSDGVGEVPILELRYQVNWVEV
jgi:hypothetical protein